MALISTSILADVSILVAVSLGLLYLYMKRNFDFWKKKGIYYVEPYPFVGNLLEVLLQRRSIGSFARKLYEDAPREPYVGVYAMGKPLLLVRDLDLIRCIMVKDAHAFLDRTFAPNEKTNPLFNKNLFGLSGKKWRNLRVKLTPTFTSGKMRKMFYLVDECGQQLTNLIAQDSSTGKSLDVKETMARYSTDVIATCAFGVNANSLLDSKSEFRAILGTILDVSLLQKFLINVASLVPSVARFFNVSILNKNVTDFVRKTVWDVVDYRKKNGVVRKDFLDLLIQIRDEGEVRGEDAKDMEEIQQDNSLTNVGYKNKTENMNIELDGDDFVAQAFVFLLAGFETSSGVLNFALYELAQNANVQDKLRREINSVLSKNGGKLTYDCFSDMPYLEMVVSETLRKYPTLPFLERKSLVDYKVPETDFTIPKGTTTMIPVWGIHYDPELYPDPDKFDPERFSTENKSKRHHFSHLPFGEGPRICIGMRFGQMQVKTALTHILSNFQVRPSAVTPKPPLVMKNYGAILMPRDDIQLTFTRVKT